MGDDPDQVRRTLDVDRTTAILAAAFGDVPADVIEHAVRTEFERHEQDPVREFVPMFVERTVRAQLREMS